MTASWPATVPQYFQEQGFSETLPDQRIESAVDSGPPKVRRRFTKNYRPIQGDIWCTSAQHTAFETFFEDTLAGGVLSFTWINPIDLTSRTFRFRGVPKKVVRGEIVIIQLQLWQLD